VFGKNRRAKIAAFAALITLGFMVFQGVTSAHNPVISAKAVCIDGTDRATITVHVESWQTDQGDDHRTHNDVVVTIAGETFHGKFNKANNFEFDIELEVAADGKTYTATATTDEFWGPNGEIEIPIGPQTRSTTVTVPMPCLPPPSTTVPPTSSIAPTSIVQSSTTTSTSTTTTTAPTSTVPVSVQGVVETAPTTAPPSSTVGTAVQGVVLARTGSSVLPLVIGGVVLVLLGTAVELNARRRRTA
jgi:hypothetical protein